MSSAIGRRIRRLEQATGNRGDDELIECELSDKAKTVMRDVLTGLMTPDEIEATVKRRQLVARSLQRGLSPEAQAMLAETLKSLRRECPPRP
jgi:Trp operon repressor